MVVAPFFDRIPDLQSLFSGQHGKKPAGSGAAATSRAEGYERLVAADYRQFECAFLREHLDALTEEVVIKVASGQKLARRPVR